MDSAIIYLERKPAWGDILRSYKIFLDEKFVGTICHQKSCSFEVQSGLHEIFLTIDWCSSRHISIDLAPNEEVKLVCQARIPWRALYNITYGANDYIQLTQEPFNNLLKP